MRLTPGGHSRWKKFPAKSLLFGTFFKNCHFRECLRGPCDFSTNSLLIPCSFARFAIFGQNLTIPQAAEKNSLQISLLFLRIASSYTFLAAQLCLLLLYYITDRRQLSQNEVESRRLLLHCIRRAAEATVDFIQLRERDLPTRDLFELAMAAARIVEEANSSPDAKTCLLINSRMDIAVSCGAAGVHLRASDLSAADARSVMMAAGQSRPVVGVSCHSMGEVELAEGQGADFAVFGPVFEKYGSDLAIPGVRGLEHVCRNRRAARPPMPVLAIGGVDVNNAAACLAAGAHGIAGIRLFQRDDVRELVKALRNG